MTKKRVFLTILLLILGYVGYQAYSFFLSPSSNLRSVYLIPKDAVILVETQEPVENWDKIRESEIWKHLQKNAYFSDLTESIQEMDAIFHKKKKLFKMFGTRSLVFSIHMYKKKEYGLFFVIDLKKIAKLNTLKEYLNTVLDDNYVLSRREYHGEEIIELYDKKSKETLHMSFIKNQLIASYTHTLVEASIDQYKEPIIGRDLNFIAVKKHTGYDDMFRLYLQYDYLDDYLRYFSDQPNEWAKTLSKNLEFSGFTFDLESNNTITAKGYTNISEDNIGYLKALQKSGTAKRTIATIAPKQTALYTSFGFDSFSEFYGNFENILKEKEASYTSYKTNYEKIEKFLKINIQENFIDWIGDEIAFLQIQPTVKTQKNDLALVVKADDIDSAKENLAFVQKQIRKRTPVKFKQINYKEHEINFMSIKGFFKLFIGGMFAKFDKPYFTIIDDYVVFSDKPKTLKRIIDDYEAKSTLANADDYQHFNRYFDSKSSVFTYINTPILYKNLYAMADAKTKVSMRKNKDFIICFPQLGFQLSPDDDMFESKLAVFYQDAELVKSKEQFKVSYGPGNQIDNALKPTNILALKDVFKVKAIFPDDLNADEHIEKYKSGEIHIKVGLKDGQKHGRYYEYYPNGEIKIKGRFKNDQQSGTWKHYDENGDFVKKKKF